MKTLTAKEVQKWFERNSGKFVPVYENGTYGDRNIYLSENEVAFLADKEILRVNVVYDTGCPTCGGAYVKEWRLESR